MKWTMLAGALMIGGGIAAGLLWTPGAAPAQPTASHREASAGDPSCGQRIAALREAYAQLKASDVPGSLRTVYSSVTEAAAADIEYDSYSGRRMARDSQRAMRAHERNMAIMGRAFTGYADARKAGCWFVPTPPRLGGMGMVGP